MKVMIARNFLMLIAVSALLFSACSKEEEDLVEDHQLEEGQIDTLTSFNGVQFVRTPESCFEDLPDWPYTYQYVEIDGLRQAYAESGPAEGEVVLLLHGQPSWSYLYKSMIPVLADAGYRVIAMDHLGMGRSDKPIDISEYSYLGHGDRLLRFIQELGLSEINLFVQDWGSLIGLRVAGLNPELFASISVGNGALPVIPAGVQVIEPVVDPNEIADLPSPFAAYPAQQIPFYDDCVLIVMQDQAFEFGDWSEYSMKGASFKASEVVEALTWYDVSAEEEAAYDAPFPSRAYMAGVRTFPSLVNEVAGQNDAALEGLTAYVKPFLTIWGDNDPGTLGTCETQQSLIDNVPGAADKPHVRLAEASHFLQYDQGVEIANRLIEFYNTEWEDGELDPCANYDSPIVNEDRTQMLIPPVDLRNFRYGEVLPTFLCGGQPITEVYVTMSYSDCPEAEWYELEADAIQDQTGALAIKLNGPRHWLTNQIVNNNSNGFTKTTTFGSLQMGLAATITGQANQQFYTENGVNRSTTYTFAAGNEIYKLINPDGEEYIMQSYSRFVDPDLSIDDLPTLASRLNLPAGWTYQTETLTSDLLLIADGLATLVTDEFENNYQKVN
ncbi:MAG: haloalkane dehalogenase [Bacteroidota bacterium]